MIWAAKPISFVAAIALGIAMPSMAQNAEPGLVDPFQSGFPAFLWSDEGIANTTHKLRTTPVSRFPAINKARELLILSQSQPGLTANHSDELSAARLNYLLRAGSIDAAEVMSVAMDWQSHAVRTEVENIALLSSRPEHYCQRLISREFTESTQGLSIYCLVRSDRWNDAVDLFGQQNGDYSTARTQILNRYLELDGGGSSEFDQPWDQLPEPFEFVLDAAFGRPHGKAELPPSYLYFERELGTTPRTNLETIEILVRNAALPSNVLFSTYKSQRSAESGGSWGRAELVQYFSRLDVNDLPRGFDAELSRAVTTFSEVDLLSPFATFLAPMFSKLDLATIPNTSTRNQLLRLALLGGWSRPEWVKHLARDDYAIVQGFRMRHPEVQIADLRSINLPTLESRIIQEAFYGDITHMHAKGTAGEQLWESLQILDQFRNNPEHKVAAAFQTLISLGQAPLARDIALEYLFAGSAA